MNGAISLLELVNQSVVNIQTVLREKFAKIWSARSAVTQTVDVRVARLVSTVSARTYAHLLLLVEQILSVPLVITIRFAPVLHHFWEIH